MPKYHALSIDEFTEEVFYWLGAHQDGGAGHYARYDGEKDECVNRCIEALRPLVDELMYESDDYGYRKSEIK